MAPVFFYMDVNHEAKLDTLDQYERSLRHVVGPPESMAKVAGASACISD